MWHRGVAVGVSPSLPVSLALPPAQPCTSASPAHLAQLQLLLLLLLQELLMLLLHDQLLQGLGALG